MGSEGWVLVFDLDETLSAVNDSEWIGKLPPFKKAILNRKAIEILKRAVALRRRGQVAAILLLTNNDSDEYIDGIVKRLEAKVGCAAGTLFDLKAKRNDTVTPRTPDPVNGAGYPLKDVVTVERMMKRLGKSTDQLASRIFFFDDIPNHVMSKEVQPSQYIVMKWVQKVDGKIVSFHDQTNYAPVHEALGYPAVQKRAGTPYPRRGVTKKKHRAASRSRDLNRRRERERKNRG
jgi:hypothetical protein